MKPTRGLLLLVLLLLPLPSFAGFFEDVPDDSPYATSIEYMRKHEIIEGYSRPGERRVFWPNESVTRAEFLKMTALALYPQAFIDGCLMDEKALQTYGLGMPFVDVSRSSWFAPYVCAARDQGLITGYGDGSFRPNSAISLPEGAKILSLGFNLAPASVPDLDTLGQEWYRPYVGYLSKAHALPPSAQGYSHLLTRGEVAEMLARLMQAPGYESPATKISLDEYAVANPVTWKEYINSDLGFAFSYPSSWPAPETLPAGAYERVILPKLHSLWRVYIGPHKDCWGWNFCIERDFSVTGFNRKNFDTALEDLFTAENVKILSDETVEGMRTILFEETTNCTAKSAFIVTPLSFYRFALNCGSKIHDPEMAFMRMFAKFRVLRGF